MHNDEEGLRGGWFPARLLRLSAKPYAFGLVEYDHLQVRQRYGSGRGRCHGWHEPVRSSYHWAAARGLVLPQLWMVEQCRGPVGPGPAPSPRTPRTHTAPACIDTNT